MKRAVPVDIRPDRQLEPSEGVNVYRTDKAGFVIGPIGYITILDDD
jgi:hypothetical protein